MPMTFPSHQGLIAPLWRRWPGRFDIAGLCIGAAMPDLIETLIWMVRGKPWGQGLGHSLIGLPLLCVPVGFLLRALLGWVARHLPASRRKGILARAWNHTRTALSDGRLAPVSLQDGMRTTGSLLLGAFSHLLFDLISHGFFPWLYPWRGRWAIFPDGWYATWMRIEMPGRPMGMKIGPHRAVWVLLSALGIWRLIRPLFTKPSPASVAVTGGQGTRHTTDCETHR